MGFYVNTPNQDKAVWLKANAVKQFTTTPRYEATGPGELLVCLVNNGPFTAAAVIVNKHEYDAFTQPTDGRPKQWYTVPSLKLKEVCPNLN